MGEGAAAMDEVCVCGVGGGEAVGRRMLPRGGPMCVCVCEGGGANKPPPDGAR